MSTRWIAASVFVALSGAAHAQSEAVLGKDDAAFATALLRGGYSDMASKLCELLLKKGALDPEEAIGVKALNLDLRLDMALRETEVIKRKDELTAILQEKEDLVRQYGGRKVAQETSATLPEVYQKLGEAISVAIQREKDPAAIAQLQKEGADIFKAAEAKLEERIKDIDDALAESTSANPKLEEQLIAARYNLPRTKYFHALLFGKADTLSRDTLLDEAVTGFQEFGLDYGDTLFAYEGLIYEGLCYKEKGIPEDALTAFDDAIRLREGYEMDAKGYYPMGLYEADIVSWGVLQKVNLLAELGRDQEAIAEADTFWKTTPDAQETRQGLAILSAKAEIYLKLGDTKNASEVADKLVEYDRGGPWGAAGRAIQGQLLSKGGPIDPDKVRRIAQTLLDQGDVEGALRAARMGVDAAGRDPKYSDAGVDLWMLIASIYLGRDPAWEHEAALAFDTAADRFAGNDKAAEAVYQASLIYTRLGRAERKNFYKERAAERQKTLTTRYPNSPRAPWIELGNGEDLVAENKFIEAAELYGRIPPTSSVYLEAQFRAGDCYFLKAREILLAKKEAGLTEAKPLAEQAERLMRKAMTEADTAFDKTLDPQQRNTFDSLAKRTRNRLAQLYLLENLGWANRVLPLLEGTDERFASDAEAISTFWQWRIEALRAQGKLEDAIALLDALMKRAPDSKAIGPAAGNLAVALDQRSVDLREKEKKPREADEMLKKAAGYYSIAGRELLKSDNPKVRQIETTAKRLYAIGLIVNEVPEDQQTFVGWDPKSVKDATHWQLAADLLGAALAIQPGYQMQSIQGRCYGFLGDYPRAALVLGALFDQNKIYDDKKAQLNRKVLQGKPELLYSYFEWGVAENKTGVQRQDADSFRRAQTIFSVMAKNLDPNSRLWWWAKYLEVRNALDAGYYQDAGFLFNDVKRTTSGFGQEFGLEPLFRAAEQELKNK